ncbi:MAG: hypothetical protein H6754_08905 [Candidatus Omnitrophica bacterium]|nr:hypothetical protein [Candidatus Omnitrophota bacterium]
MKKNIAVITVVAVLAVSGLAFAQVADKGKDMMEGKGGMMGMMDGKMMGMCPMMQSMLQKQVVATNDGGIVVVAGNKITKYDKDLNVVKEVEQKMDMEGMKKMMKDCPMMGKGMMGNMSKDAGVASNSETPTKEVDHASHH